MAGGRTFLAIKYYYYWSSICPLQRAARSPGRSAFDENLAHSPADQGIFHPRWWAVSLLLLQKEQIIKVFV
ncbi:hypothetical protein ASPTUDRAFT_211466 [Aspergillus tubingensis CBS 134.48]|uniref:Uncharacterized protein n=1 Tax=Aspergillus tubingensis (strain CBS 134.48) TaxID=767770 RepID=A0A1L9NLA3_ASPTC|nr:hypothetical protein ASPTUDRAFT_211466 [Aspergillus tubingensis CBS 134.48]